MQYRIVISAVLGMMLSVVIGFHAPVFAGWAKSISTPVWTLEAATLQAPSDLKATAASSLLICTVQLTWTNTQPQLAIDGWEIQRFVGANPNSGVGRIPAGTTTFTDLVSLSLLTVYTYKVRAYKGNWVSPDASITPLLTVLCL